MMADMMFTALDWEQIAQLIRAARGTGIAPLIRVQAYPWADGIDRRTISDAARALALGATAMTVFISSLEQTQEILRLRAAWHRLIHLRRFPSAADFSVFTDRMAAETCAYRGEQRGIAGPGGHFCLGGHRTGLAGCRRYQ
jgi:hypothetical protein